MVSVSRAAVEPMARWAWAAVGGDAVGHRASAPVLRTRRSVFLMGLARAHRMCKDSHMATNLAIDDKLLERALRIGGEKTKKATVTEALREYIARREQATIVELFGKVDVDPSYDYKERRRRR